VLLKFALGSAGGQDVQWPHGHAEYPHAVLRQGIVAASDPGGPLLGHRANGAALPHAVAQRDQFVHRAFGKGDVGRIDDRPQELDRRIPGIVAVGQAVHSGHALALGGERRLRNAGHDLLDVGLPEPEAGRHPHERPLRRIADGGELARIALPSLKRGVVGQGAPGEEQGKVAIPAVRDLGIPVPVAAQNGWLAALEALAHGERIARHVEHRHRHAVFGQGARLVRADRGDGAQRLDGRQSADQCPPPDHALRPQREGNGYHRGQSLGHRGHGQADGDEEHLLEGLTADDHALEKDKHHDHERDDSQPLAEFRHAPLERRLFLRHGLQHGGDVAQFRVHAGARHSSHSAAIGDVGAHVGHVPAVAQRDLVALDGICDLLDGHGFAGQRGLVDAQVSGFDDARVRRHPHPCLQQDDIPGHHVGGGDLLHIATAADLDGGNRQPAQGGHGLLSTVLLRKAQNRVQDHDNQNHDRVDSLAD